MIRINKIDPALKLNTFSYLNFSLKKSLEENLQGSMYFDN